MDIEREEFLEYDLTSRIFSLARENKPKIGFITGLGIDGVLDAQGGAVQPWKVMGQINEFFDEHLGVHLKDIVTVGTSDPNAKALQIRKFANLYKPSVIHFYDDSPANIAAVDKIASTHPDLQDVEVITHHVSESDR